MFEPAETYEFPFPKTIVHSRSVDPRKLRVGVKYYIVRTCMYSMPYYTYGRTANFLFLEPTALIYVYISKERCCDEDLRCIRIFLIE